MGSKSVSIAANWMLSRRMFLQSILRHICRTYLSNVCLLIEAAPSTCRYAPTYRICEKAGAERVSESSAKEMDEVFEDMGIRIGEEATAFAMHMGRETVKTEDTEIPASFKPIDNSEQANFFFP